MSYNLEIEKRGHFLFVTAQGIRTHETLISIAEEVVGACIKHSVREAVVDISNLEGRLSIGDSYLIATKSFPKLHRLGTLDRVVLVDCEENGERIKFFGRIAQGLGMNVQVFMDINEALKIIPHEAIINVH